MGGDFFGFVGVVTFRFIGFGVVTFRFGAAGVFDPPLDCDFWQTPSFTVSPAAQPHLPPLST
ncbi:MAG: hypothetical protein WBF58_14345 [Xanthobacteraceae bacterium]